MIWHLQAGEQGTDCYESQSESKDLRTKEAQVQRLCHGQKAKIDVFLELSCFSDDQTDDDTLNSSKKSKFVLFMPFCSIHTLSKLDDVSRHY